MKAYPIHPRNHHALTGALKIEGRSERATADAKMRAAPLPPTETCPCPAPDDCLYGGPACQEGERRLRRIFRAGPAHVISHSETPEEADIMARASTQERAKVLAEKIIRDADEGHGVDLNALALARALLDGVPAPEKTAIYYERAPVFDKRIASGDDYAGDAWVCWTAVGHRP